MMRGFNNLPGGPGGAGGETPDCGTCIKNAWNSVPAWNRAVMIVPIILYLGSLAAPIVAYYTACIPVLVFSKFEGKFLITFWPTANAFDSSLETYDWRLVPSLAYYASICTLLIRVAWSQRGKEDRHSCFLLQILDRLDHNHGSVRFSHRCLWVRCDYASCRTLVNAFCRPCYRINGSTRLAKTVSTVLFYELLLVYAASLWCWRLNTTHGC